MSGVSETAESLYSALEMKSRPKAKKSLLNIKKACDQIVLARGTINYTRVAKVATELYGGPKPQTILNSAMLRRYIDRRIDEYLQSSKLPDRNEIAGDRGKNRRKYPSDKLDLKTKVYIDLLLDRVAFVEARYKKLQDWQERFTKANPIDMAASISLGPSADGAMNVVDPPHYGPYFDRLKEALNSFLSLTENISNLKILESDGRVMLILKRPSGDHTVLTPAQFDAIQWFLNAETVKTER